MSTKKTTKAKQSKAKGKKAPAPSKRAKLTEKQELFCRSFVICLNATQAAIEAGYSENAASEIGYENLRKPQIVERIANLKKESLNRVQNEEKFEITADAVLREVGRVAMFRPENFAKIDDKGQFKYIIDKDNLHLLAGITGIKVKECKPITIVEMGIEIEREVVEVEFKSDKTKALEMLMKHLGLLKEKVEVEGMDRLVEALHAGRARVAALKREREQNGETILNGE